MKKQILKSALIAVAGIGLLAGSVWADTMNVRPVAIGTSGEPSLDDIFKGIGTAPNFDGKITNGSIDTINDQQEAAIWTSSDYTSNAYIVTGYAGWTSKLGIYNFSDTQEITFTLKATGTASFSFNDNNNDGIFGDLVVDDGNGIGYYDNFGTSFGFYLNVAAVDQNNNITYKNYYTEDSKNGDTAMALAYLIPLNASINLSGPSAVKGTGDDWILAFEDGGGDFDFNDKLYVIEDINAVPEPATMLLFGTGIAGLAGIARRRKSN